MVGILLLMHEPLADAFMTTAMHLFEGEQGRIEAVDVKPDQDICEVNKVAIEAIRRLDDGSGVLVLTDVLGGTPSNCCHQLSAENKVSLPMLLRAITYRQSDLETVIEKALSGGKNGAVRIDPCEDNS